MLLLHIREKRPESIRQSVLHRTNRAAGRAAPRGLTLRDTQGKLGSDAERVAFLFERYQALTSLLPAAKPARTRRRAEADA